MIKIGDILSSNDVGPIYFIEPELASKRKGVIDKRLGKAEMVSSKLEEQLLDIRKEAVRNTQKNLKIFKSHIKNKNMFPLHMAETPEDVIKYIINQSKRFKPQLRKIAVNHSNTIRNLKPELIRNGFDLWHTYEHAVESGTLGKFSDSTPGQYWTLRNLELNNTFSTFNLNMNPRVYTKEILTGTKADHDFIGLIGANVFTATGKIISVQHMYNISSILSHAKLTFVVLTVDKLVESFADAMFQARCAAMYGLEQIILDLFDVQRIRGKDEIKGKGKSQNAIGVGNSRKKMELSEDNYQVYKPPQNLQVILLDDSRSEFIGSKREELLYCISCRRCGLHCPRIRSGADKDGDTKKNIEPGTSLLTAHELLMDGFLYGPKLAIERGLFDCTLCRFCSNICPVGIDLTSHLLDLRERCQGDDLFAEPHKRIRNNILEVGTAYGSEYSMKTGGRK